MYDDVIYLGDVFGKISFEGLDEMRGIEVGEEGEEEALDVRDVRGCSVTIARPLDLQRS